MKKQRREIPIKEIVNSLKGYKPEKIILFGSATNGRLMPGSDIDLLVVKKTKRNPWARTREADRFIDHHFPLDLLVYTPKEIEERITENDFFIKEIIESGKVIYEKRS